jgi:oxalate decarboxylase/phosphoglucose isomerase-like protein (cupin superfamily)
LGQFLHSLQILSVFLINQAPVNAILRIVILTKQKILEAKMKRFVISVLCASVFFLGLGGLIDKASARFKSDQKALELIAAARTAIGGDANIREVRSMTVKGATTNFFDKEGVPATELGGVEINFELPGKFSKMVKIGEPTGDENNAHVEKKIDVVVVSKDGEGAGIVSEASEGAKNVFVIRKGDGDVEWKSDGNAEFKAEGNRIIMKRDDGTVVELPKDGAHKVIVRESTDSGSGVWNTEDGKQIVIERDETSSGSRSLHSGNEMLRTTMALLMTAPEGVDVGYKFVGEGDVDGYPSNIVQVDAQGASFKLYLDASSNLPRMISYTGHQAVFFKKMNTGEMSKEALIQIKEAAAEPVEHQVRFSDFRSVEGLTLPYRWSETVGGKQAQIVDITSYEINPANIADKFGNQRIFVRKAKPDGN